MGGGHGFRPHPPSAPIFNLNAPGKYVKVFPGPTRDARAY